MQLRRTTLVLLVVLFALSFVFAYVLTQSPALALLTGRGTSCAWSVVDPGGPGNYPENFSGESSPSSCTDQLLQFSGGFEHHFGFVYPQSDGTCKDDGSNSVCSGTCNDGAVTVQAPGVYYVRLTSNIPGDPRNTKGVCAKFCSGTNYAGQCVPPVCGDNFKDPTEECDDGNTSNNDGCSNLCKIEKCGDAVIQPNGVDKLPGTADDEQCDLGADNGKPDQDCSSSCKIRCGDNSCDANECSTTVAGKLKCETDCRECTDGCNNDGDVDKKDANNPLIDTPEEVGCYQYQTTWNPSPATNNPVPVPLQGNALNSAKEADSCPQFQGPALTFRVVGELWIKDGEDNMCVPKENFAACNLGTSATSSPYQNPLYPAVRWPAIEQCCRAQATFLADYLCNNSTKFDCSVKPTGNSANGCALCSAEVRKAIIEEMVAECSCSNAGGAQAREQAINFTMSCEKAKAGDVIDGTSFPSDICPGLNQCGGGTYEQCGGCLGQVQPGGGTKADTCMAFAINHCVPFSGSASSSSSSRSSSSASAVCGNGVKEGSEQCDDGTNNIPAGYDDLPLAVMLQLQTDADGKLTYQGKEYTLSTLYSLENTSRTCTSSCTRAQCSDGVDNNDAEDAVADRNDPGCYMPCSDGTCKAMSTAYLPGRDSEVDRCNEASIAAEPRGFWARLFAFLTGQVTPPAPVNACACEYKDDLLDNPPPSSQMAYALPPKASLLTAAALGFNGMWSDICGSDASVIGSCSANYHCTLFGSFSVLADCQLTAKYYGGNGGECYQQGNRYFINRCKLLVDEGEVCRTTRDCRDAWNGSTFDPNSIVRCYETLNGPIGGGICCGGNVSCGKNGGVCPYVPARWSVPLAGGGGSPPGGAGNSYIYPDLGGIGWQSVGTGGGGNSSQSASYTSQSSARSASSASSAITASSNGSLGYCCQPDKVCRRAPGCTQDLLSCLLECSGASISSSGIAPDPSPSPFGGSSTSSVSSVTSSASTSRTSLRSSSLQSSGISSSVQSVASSISSRPDSSTHNVVSSARSASSSFRPIVFNFSSVPDGGVIPSACRGDECGIGGSAFCALSGKKCSTINNLPCIACQADEFVYACSGQECAIGGAEFCGLSGTSCVIDNTVQQCFRCMGSSSSAASLYSCNGNECSLGGDQFCSLTNTACVQDATNQQCFRCESSAASAASRSSAMIVLEVSSEARRTSSLPPTIEIADLPAFCGNGVVEVGEECDEAAQNSDMPNALCRTDCRLARCGDGIPDTPLEICDDGNLFNGDGCSATCQLERTAPQTLPAQIIDLPFTPTTNNQQPITSNDQTTTNGQYSPVPPANTDTGPAALAVMVSGAAAGYAFMRRRR